MPSRILDLGQAKELIIVSDVHMRHPEDQRAELFCQFLDTVDSCDTLILLGDIFDFINARQVFYRNLWDKVFQRLRALRKKGIKVVFIEGNHDYGFEHNPCSQIAECFDHCGDFIAHVRHDVLGNILFLHSDDIVCPPSYRLFRSLIKSKLFQDLMSPIPGSATSALFSKYAAASRTKDQYRKLSREFLTSCVDRFIRSELHESFNKIGFCVFGHIHVCLDDKRENIRFISGPDWFSAPNSMRLTANGQLERAWYCPNDKIPERFLFHASDFARDVFQA